MSSDPVPAAPSKSRRALLLVSLVALVVVVAVISTASPSWLTGGVSGDGDDTHEDDGHGNDTIARSVADMILSQDDLPHGWTVASPFYPGYQGDLPGEYVEAGGIGLNFTTGGESMYVTVLLVRCDNISQAQGLWTGVKSTFNNTKPGAWYEANYTDAALLTQLGSTGMGSHQGKYLWFMHQNLLCGMVFTFIDGSERTDQQLIDFANLQLEKLN